MRSKKQIETVSSFDSVLASLKETGKRFQEIAIETKAMQKETREMKKRLESMYEESRRERKEMNRHLGGIDNSNGEMAEQYFYSAFKANRTFAQEKFDSVEKRWSKTVGNIEAEFDILLFNGKSIALIEVKYCAKPDNIRVRDIISRVEIFKILYPEYKNYIIYLGVAAMAFRNGMERRLHRHGIATIRQVGKKMLVYDTEVKAF